MRLSFILIFFGFATSASAQFPCDVAVMSGNVLMDGVGDLGANALTLRELVYRLSPSRRICIIINPESEGIFRYRKTEEVRARNKNWFVRNYLHPKGKALIASELNEEMKKYPVEAYEKVFSFYGILGSDSGIFNIRGREIPWITEDKARRIGFSAAIGVVTSIFPEVDLTVSKYNSEFLDRISSFARDWITSEDYASKSVDSIGKIRALSARSYGPKGMSGLSLSTGARNSYFYFFKSAPDHIPAPQWRVLINPSGPLDSFYDDNLEKIDNFIDFNLRWSAGRRIVFYVSTDKDRAYLESRRFSHKFKSSSVTVEVIPRLRILQFIESISEFDAVFSGGLTLGTMAMSSGIPTFFQSRPHLDNAFRNNRRLVTRALFGTGPQSENISEMRIANRIAELGPVSSRQALEKIDHSNDLFAEIEGDVELAMADRRNLPLSVKRIALEESLEGKKVRLFLEKVGCLKQ